VSEEIRSPFLEHRVPELLDEVVAMYRAAGRPLAPLTDGDLDTHFTDMVAAYIGDPRNPARFRAVNNVAAEYVLRRREAPATRVVRLKEGPEAEANQPHKPKLAVFLGKLPGYEALGLPMVVLAFGRYAVIPALGAIAEPEGSEEKPRDWNSTGVEMERAKEQWRQERDAHQAEFRWLLGLSAGRGERDVNLDAARAKWAADNSH
jgi:hypothetical protein